MYWQSPKYALVRDLEAALGCPHENGLFSYARRVEEDEEENYPQDALSWLDSWGMQQHYVPFCVGGVLSDFDVLFSLVRTISRRDLTVAISHAVSFLGAAGVWIAGSPDQKANLARRLLRGERISLALTERNHGGDLLSYETKVEHSEEGRLLLSGEKWLINGVTRNPLVSVLARTNSNGGPRGFSLFLFDKQAAQLGSFDYLRKVRTLGVRGSDISGIRFQNAVLTESEMVGACGEGFEIVLKGLQLSRILCGAISLGAAETAFHVTLDFARARRVYGQAVLEIPQCRRVLLESWVDLVLCESLLIAAARSLHFVPSEASVHSAVIKYLVPRLLEHTIKQLSSVLGARYYLREEHHSGIFQKMLRDSSLVSLFDGSSVVNLYSLTTQFKALSRSWKSGSRALSSELQQSICDLAAPLPDFSWNSLSLTSDGQNCFVGHLRSSLKAAGAMAGSQYGSRAEAAALLEQIEFLTRAADCLMAKMSDIHFGSPHAMNPAAIDLAGDFCILEAAAMVLQMWLSNRNQIEQDPAGRFWLVLSLQRLNGYLGQKTTFDDLFLSAFDSQLFKAHDEWLASYSRPAASAA